MSWRNNLSECLQTKGGCWPHATQTMTSLLCFYPRWGNCKWTPPNLQLSASPRAEEKKKHATRLQAEALTTFTKGIRQPVISREKKGKNCVIYSGNVLILMQTRGLDVEEGSFWANTKSRTRRGLRKIKALASSVESWVAVSVCGTMFKGVQQ